MAHNSDEKYFFSQDWDVDGRLERRANRDINYTGPERRRIPNETRLSRIIHDMFIWTMFIAVVVSTYQIFFNK